MKALMIVSHPNLEESIANSTIIKEVRSKVTDLEIRHVEQLYPDFKIDVEAEQSALLEADIIIFQHPFYWYSTPAGLKHWMDEVLTYGFAFGHDGDKLKGKHFIQSLTVGGPKESYKADGYNHFTIEQFLRPIEQTVYLTMMAHHGFIHSHRNAYIEGAYNSRREVLENAQDQANKLICFIEELRKGAEPKIIEFIAKWFSGFDDLDENSFFTQYIDPNIKMNMIGASPITSIEDFNSWYGEARQMFETPTEHIISNVEVLLTEQQDHYKVTFDVVLNATLSSDQSNFSINAKEKWLLQWDNQSNRPIIKEYDVWADEEEKEEK